MGEEEIMWKPSPVQLNNMAEAVTNQNPQPNVSGNEAEKKGPQNQPVPEEFKHKNRLQEFTQRASLGHPIYHTINEGAQHAPLFRTSVLVDGIWYTSPNTFSHLKAAEQDAAKIALSGVKERVKHGGCPLIREDTVFCKSILNEYAVKMNVEKPTYQTVQYAEVIPVFKSTSVFNGVQYMGETGKNKKEAEQLAARAAIMSILETDSAIMMLEIIKSKHKLYAALDKVQDTGYFHAGITPTELTPPVHLEKRKEVEVNDNAGQMTNTGHLAYIVGQPSDVQAPNHLHVFKKPKPGSSSVEVAALTHVEQTKEVEVNGNAGQTINAGLLSYPVRQPSDVQAANQLHVFKKPLTHVEQTKEVEVNANTGQKINTGLLSYRVRQPSYAQAPNKLHVFKKPNAGSSSVEVAPPIVFVPPISDPSLLCSTSAKKRRRNKKKAQQNVPVGTQVPGANAAIDSSSPMLDSTVSV